MELRNFCRGRHLYSAGRPSRWASAHIVVISCLQRNAVLTVIIFHLVLPGLTKRLNEWKNNMENRGMRVNMNKTKVMISGERLQDGRVVYVPEMLVALQYNVLVVTSGYTRSVVV